MRRPDHNRPGTRIGGYKPDLEQIAQKIDDIGQSSWRIYARNVEGAHCHALVLAAIFGSVGSDQNLVSVEGRPKGLSYCPRGHHRFEKIDVVDIKNHTARRHRILDLRRNPVGTRNRTEKLPAVPAEMEAGQVLGRR